MFRLTSPLLAVWLAHYAVAALMKKAVPMLANALHHLSSEVFVLLLTLKQTGERSFGRCKNKTPLSET